MLAGVSARSLPTEPPIVKLQYSSARVEVTNCVRRTCCYEYYIRLMQSGSVILVSGTRRRAQAEAEPVLPMGIAHSVSFFCVSPSSLVHLISLAPSLLLPPFLICSLSVSQHGSCTVFPAHQGGRGVSAAFALCRLRVSRPQPSVRQDS